MGSTQKSVWDLQPNTHIRHVSGGMLAVRSHAHTHTRADTRLRPCSRKNATLWEEVGCVAVCVSTERTGVLLHPQHPTHTTEAVNQSQRTPPARLRLLYNNSCICGTQLTYYVFTTTRQNKSLTCNEVSQWIAVRL